MYNKRAMIIKSLLHSNESYTHKNWVYRDVCVGFSRLYYIIDGEAYYEEEGRKHRLKKGFLYLTPVRRPFTLYDNPDDRLLHTYSHIVTSPPVTELTEVEVLPGTPLEDAVTMWRKYIEESDSELQLSIIQLILSCLNRKVAPNEVAQKAKAYIDSVDAHTLDMPTLSRNLGYSREHITRAFSAAYRITPMQYFNTKRMNLALSILTDGVRVCEVAEILGYASQYSFSKAFKGHFGLSPTKYLATLSRPCNTSERQI